MTIIEFFDKTAIENMLSALHCQPDRVVYIGDSTKRMNRSMKGYREVLAARGAKVQLLCRSVGKNNLQRIVQTLSELVEQDPHCVFNLDGGEDLYLVAIGMVAQRYPDRVQLCRFNVRNNTIIDCDADGNDHLTSPIAISVEEEVRIYGGAVIYEEQKPGTTRHWDFSDSFCRDIRTMWEICRQDPKAWNKQINAIGCLDELFPQSDERAFSVSQSIAKTALEAKKELYELNTELLHALEEKKLISWLQTGGDTWEFVFKNSQVKHCLTKAGQLLELYITLIAMELREEDGSPVYNDVQTGVYIDWDAELQPAGGVDVSNEIDVMMMKGAVPVFVSCKNGNVTQDELFKFSHVAQRFGGKYAKMVLAAPELDKMGAKAKPIRARAAEMDIRIVEDIDKMEEAELKRIVKSLWFN